MIRKSRLIILAALTFGVILLGSTSLIQANDRTEISDYSSSMESVPASLMYDSEHPDEIYVKDCGVFVKMERPIMDYSGMIVAHDLQQVTKETAVIFANGDQYLKQKGWN
ncbi:hypothetical protein [Paenibacillus sp. FSL R7-0652]|uniref:Copper amine oxidase-like N-terminal domain-containing protein n=1 Tax=Paenibacillus sp. AN1007 TaxID=3151385 RepID=A0AAU8NGP4_9BACL